MAREEGREGKGPWLKEQRSAEVLLGEGGETGRVRRGEAQTVSARGRVWNLPCCRSLSPRAAGDHWRIFNQSTKWNDVVSLIAQNVASKTTYFDQPFPKLSSGLHTLGHHKALSAGTTSLSKDSVLC